jgi:hypothetical protein
MLCDIQNKGIGKPCGVIISHMADSFFKSGSVISAILADTEM